MSNNVLLVAFHFPPYGVSSGVYRTYNFAKYLPEYGWRPLVLTANPRAYPVISDWDGSDRGIPVTRAFALDTVRHLGFKGRYPGLLALPDRWVTWAPPAIFSGLRLIKRYNPAVIWTTYPIATAHLIGAALHRFTGIPWVADFRDPMVDTKYPIDKLVRKLFTRIQSAAVRHAAACCFTTDGAKMLYEEQFPEVPSNRWKVVYNGYDEEDLANVPTSPHREKPSDKSITLLHSGSVYKVHRDPSCLFRALRALRDDGFLSEKDTQIRFRAPGNADFVRQQCDHFGVSEMVSILPVIEHKEALEEMSAADGLLLIQGADCNQQIPAKVYEYLRTFRPIFAMTDSAGDTADLLRLAGISDTVPLDNSREITKGLRTFIQRIRQGSAPIPRAEFVLTLSRKSQTKRLAEVFHQIAVCKS